MLLGKIALLDITYGYILVVCTGPSLAGPAYVRWFFKRLGLADKWEVIFPTGRADPANERWLFFQRTGLAKEKWVFHRPHRATEKERRKILFVSPGRQIYCFIIIIIIIITECVSQSLSSLLFIKLGLTHTFCDRFWRLILRLNVVLNEVLFSFVICFLYLCNLIFFLWEIAESS